MTTRRDILEHFGITEVNSGAFNGEWLEAHGPAFESVDPSNGTVLATVTGASLEDYDAVVEAATEAFDRWRMLPAPQRGEYVRRIGNALREHRDQLGALVSMEMGKILPEGIGEVQEMIDICDFAVGLSRQLYGLTMASERPRHRMYEQWHPLGPIGVISAFNFPVAVWSWNATIGAVCGDPIVWKPSERTPLTAVAVTKIVHSVMEGSGFEAVFGLVVGDGSTVGDAMSRDRRLPLTSATGSCRMGRILAPIVAERMGRSILELGGNNAIIVMDDADPDLAIRAALFSAVGTAGQRCTSLRRLLVQRGITDEMLKRLATAYEQVPIGDPLADGTLMGPLTGQRAVDEMLAALEAAVEQGGEIVTGGKAIDGDGFFVQPTIVKIGADAPIVQTETFAPILYVIEFETLDEAIAIQNGVEQGLSSAIFTDSVRSAETFLSHIGSDCGIANVNIGTTTINWGGELPLAQGIEFG